LCVCMCVHITLLSVASGDSRGISVGTHTHTHTYTHSDSHRAHSHAHAHRFIDPSHPSFGRTDGTCPGRSSWRQPHLWDPVSRRSTWRQVVLTRSSTRVSICTFVLCQLFDDSPWTYGDTCQNVWSLRYRWTKGNRRKRSLILEE
jgi:hypothetical protein